MKTFRTTRILALAAVLILFIFACSGKKEAEGRSEAASGQGSDPAEQKNTADAGTEPLESAPVTGDWEETFKFVRETIRTEPSLYPLKTTEGVRWSRSGNSLEKALLLAQILQDMGKTVRLAEGELDDVAAKNLLESVFPAAKSFSYQSDVPVSAPVEDRNLIAAMKRHFWVQMEDRNDWIDLDPSFPAAKPGQVFCSANDTFDPADEALKTRVSISLEYREGNDQEDQSALSWEGNLEEIANQPLSLTILAEFQNADAQEGNKEEEEGGAVGGVFGGLGGGGRSKAKKSQAGEKIFYNAALKVEDENISEGEFTPERGDITRVVLKMKFEARGEVVSECERLLFEKTEFSSQPPIFQRHAILISGSRIPAEAWEGRLKALSDTAALAEVKSRVEEIKQGLQTKENLEDALAESIDLEQKLGADLGHLVNMIFASTSEDLTRQESEALSVLFYYTVPRILITSFSGTQERSEASFDLRQDRVEAVPLPGQALSMTGTFLYGRGVMESILEGQLLELLTGKPALTTAVLMQEAARKNIPIRMFSSIEKENLKKLGPPDIVAEKLFSVLDSGRIIIIPEASIEWQGRKRWGWWDIDPVTMETVGVLDTGVHQAVVQRSILETEGPLQSKMGSSSTGSSTRPHFWRRKPT
jgi:hypothetical protein